VGVHDFQTLMFPSLREKKRDYIAAVHAVLARDYAPMIAVFHAIIRRTLRSVATTSSE